MKEEREGEVSQIFCSIMNHLGNEFIPLNIVRVVVVVVVYVDVADVASIGAESQSLTVATRSTDTIDPCDPNYDERDVSRMAFAKYRTRSNL